MDKVWILASHYECEGDYILGVYSSLKKAKEALGEVIQKREGHTHLSVDEYNVDPVEIDALSDGRNVEAWSCFRVGGWQQSIRDGETQA